MKFTLYDETGKNRGTFERAKGMPWGDEVLPIIAAVMDVGCVPEGECHWTATDEDGSRYNIGYSMIPEGWCRLRFNPDGSAEKVKP